MIATLEAPTLLSSLLEERAHESAARLEADPFYSRLLVGDVSRDEYAAWLCQMHKYVRYSERLVHQLVITTAGSESADDQALHAYAVHEEHEEAAHDDLLVVDLGRLLGVRRHEARGRIEMSTTAPSIHTYSRLRDVFMVRHPKAALGVAFALETISSLHADRIRDGLLNNSRIEGIERATTFLRAHRAEVEEDHRSSAMARIDALNKAEEVSAIYAMAGVALNMHEGIAFYLAQSFPR